MKSSRLRRPKKASHERSRRPPTGAHADRNRHIAVRAAPAPAERDDAAGAAREESVRHPDHPPGVEDALFRSREGPAQSRADGERLMGQVQEANARLIVAAIHAQNLSEEAQAETARARSELEDLMRQLQGANVRLTAAAAHAHTMVEEARQHEEEYRRLSVRLLQLQDDERRRLAVDLHDSMGQRLAALTMNLDLIPREPRQGSTAHRAARWSRVDLWPSSALERCGRWPICCTHRCSMRWAWCRPCAGTPRVSRDAVALTWSCTLEEIGRLPKPIETALFRVVQESLTNVHRHASASTASIRLTTTADTIVLDIKDEGHGLRDDRARHESDGPAAGRGDPGHARAHPSAGRDLQRRIHRQGHDRACWRAAERARAGCQRVRAEVECRGLWSAPHHHTNDIRRA